jgi:alpha,alpha-trehalase
MLGLQVSRKISLIQSMVDNFSYLLDKVGHIPNGNRTYYVGRSQPPFYALMVRLLSEEKGLQILVDYLPFLEKEYKFWMLGSEELSPEKQAVHRVVKMPDGSILNRFWDENNTPRPESFKEDIELAHLSNQKPEELFRHLRAAAESGWDFSSRWFRDTNDFGSIHTTDIIPVDLNCLLVYLEETLAAAYSLADNKLKSENFKSLAESRKTAIQNYCWNEAKGFYFDYDFIENTQKQHYTLAATFPLFFRVATATQAQSIAKILEQDFLKSGGLLTTLSTTGQQWDAPNGWAPLQWIAYKGLLNYCFTDLANQVKNNWIDLNKKVYEQTGKMTEKYNVNNQNQAAGGGEYPNQDGFGWTNGVFLAMSK